MWACKLGCNFAFKFQEHHRKHKCTCWRTSFPGRSGIWIPDCSIPSTQPKQQKQKNGACARWQSLTSELDMPENQSIPIRRAMEHWCSAHGKCNTKVDPEHAESVFLEHLAVSASNSKYEHVTCPLNSLFMSAVMLSNFSYRNIAVLFAALSCTNIEIRNGIFAWCALAVSGSFLIR